MQAQEHKVGMIAGLVLVTSTMVMSQSLALLSRMLHVPAASPLDDVTASTGLPSYCDPRRPVPAADRRASEARLSHEAKACYARTRPVTGAFGTPPMPRS